METVRFPPLGSVSFKTLVISQLVGVVVKRRIAPDEKFNVKVWLRLVLGCDLHKGVYGTCQKCANRARPHWPGPLSRKSWFHQRFPVVVYCFVAELSGENKSN